ncbi:MAG: hypothetical protein Q8R47_05870 [Nanoarchaeota archaeon]|nr:hypothetical protein [Nanoarchaeota archaeon]
MKQDYDLEFQLQAAMEESAKEFFEILSLLESMYLYPEDTNYKKELEQKYDHFMALREKGMPGRYDLQQMRWEALDLPAQTMPDEAYERIITSALSKLPAQQQPIDDKKYGETISLEELLKLGEDYVCDVAEYVLDDAVSKNTRKEIEPELFLAACLGHYLQGRELPEEQREALDYFKDQLLEFNASIKGTAYAGQGLDILLDFYDFLKNEEEIVN